MILKDDPEGRYVFPIIVHVDGKELTPGNRALLEQRAEFYRRRAENAANGVQKKTVEVDLEMLKEMISALYDVEALLLRAPPGDPDQECALHPEFVRLLKAFKPFTGRQ